MRLCARSFVFWAAATALLNAEKLPLRGYTTADGLPHNTVVRIVQDSHGLIWFCTFRGLARFDGYGFKSYDAAQGLRGIVTDLLETREGEYWVATLSGLYRFNARPANQPMFEPHSIPGAANPGVHALAEDKQGVIWAGTNSGLYRLVPSNGRRAAHLVDVSVPGASPNTVRVYDVLEARDGAIWVGLRQAGVRRLRIDGGIDSFTSTGLPGADSTPDASHGVVRSMFEDREGRIWLASAHAVSVLEKDPASGQMRRVRMYGEKDGFRNDDPQVLGESADGKMWVGTSAGLSGCKDTFTRYLTAAQDRGGAMALTGDRDGNLWIGTETGVLRLALDGFTTYDETDGLGSSRVYWVSESAAANLSVVTPGAHGAEINEFDGRRFRKISPRLPFSNAAFPEPTRASGLQDRAGDWWVATDRGLCYYSGLKKTEDLARVRPTAVYTNRDGLPDAGIISLFGDSRGDLWVGSGSSAARSGFLSRWQRATRTFHRYGAAEGLTTSTAPLSFAEDRAGDLWAGFQFHDLVRYRGGSFQVFTPANGLPPGSIWDLHIDRKGRLWVATTEGGVVRVDHPEAEQPHFAAYTTANGLSSNQVQALTEDLFGRIYVLTDRGADRLDPKTGWMKHYTFSDGLVNSSHWGTALRDRNGDLWFGTSEGLSRLTPRGDEAEAPTAVRISGIRLRGDPYPVSELGQAAFTPLLLRPDLNQIQIDFAGVNFAVGDVPRYQYKLEGADPDWSRLTDQRAVNYATLSPGKYRFLVRAVNWKGMASSEPAALEFRVLAPFWQRWWFLTLVAIAAASFVYWLHSFRVARLLELERIRGRIAADLHDDIGASLSQIAVLSEVARMELARGENHAEEPLTRIAGMSRELVDSMSEIVWSVNPHKDRLRDLAQHMREFAEDVFVAQDVVFEFRAVASEMRLGMEARRQIFLVFKECVHNIARHSGCTKVEATLETEGDWLVLRVSDNGHGFDRAEPSVHSGSAHGHGLESMQRRALSLGGYLEIATACGRGVTVTLRVPLSARRMHAEAGPVKRAG
jgi:ligand-binding sensor domain-containing protein/two-component sensor histidine kinase